jgi:hypothetical protein
MAKETKMTAARKRNEKVGRSRGRAKAMRKVGKSLQKDPEEIR